MRQVGLISQAALAYDPYRAAVEKRLAKYFAFSFRWNARKRGEPLVRSVNTLLEQGGLSPDPARPQRYRDRLERALNRLRSDHVIAEWNYTGDPAELPARHWFASWQTMRIIIHPPHDIVLGNARLRRSGTPRALTPEQ